MRKQTFKQKARNFVAGGLVGIAGLVAGCSEGINQIKDSPLKFSADTSYVSDWVAPAGAYVAGPTSKTTVAANKGPLTLWSWHGRALDKNENDKQEIDFGANYNHKINDKLSLNVGVMTWTYPNDYFSDHSEYLVGARLNQSGPVDVSVGVNHMFKGPNVPDGECFTGKISKTLPLNKKGNITITPSLSAAFTRDFYGTDGWRHLTPSISLDYTNKKGNFSVSGFISNQQSLNRETTEDNLIYSGAKVTFKF